MKNLKEFTKIISYLKEDRKKVITAVVLIVTSSLIGISYGFLNGLAIEAITNLDIKKSLICLGIYFLASVIGSSFLYEKSLLILRKVEVTLTNKLIKDVYQKVLNLPAAAFEVKTSGELINRITSDTETLSNTFSSLLQMIINVFGSLIVLIYIFNNSVIIFFETIIFVGLLYLLSKYFSPKLKKNDEKVKMNNDEYTSLVTESIRGIREIKTLGIKENVFVNVRKLMKDLLEIRGKQITTDIKYEIITDFFRSFFEVLVFVTCAILLYYGKSSLTFFIAMTYYVYRYTWIITNLTEFNKSYQKVKVSFTRINEILENKLFKDEEFGTKLLANPKGIVEFKKVNFGYNEEEDILKDFNINFEPNKKIAIVGKSGQGKSTIFNLLTKIFNARSGQILIDNIDIHELSESALRDTVSVIRQDPYIFNKTIKENFKIINPKISLKEIRKYTKMAYLDDYIMSLPKKYDTLLGEGGTNLSGGQKQRLAIARVLANKSKIILFDEATSALDNESQEFIGDAINNLVKDHTVIIIAHRLSTIKDADIIYVIDEGKVNGYGTHKDLLKSSKIYKSLYKKDLE